ncbi:hypothetical protein [Arthrobacter methylotrophus]|uniref:hypothetical protein n=1 Tax=Arthrobacter methylotrophus TaxID=121291 RepID=UPI0031E51793
MKKPAPALLTELSSAVQGPRLRNEMHGTFEGIALPLRRYGRAWFPQPSKCRPWRQRSLWLRTILASTTCLTSLRR